MNKQLDFKIKTDYEVIGQGGMIYAPQQIGEWWVTPAQDYKGNIPSEIQQKMFEFLNSGEPVVGFLIAEDIRDVQTKQEKETKKKEATLKAVATGVGTVARVVGQIVAGLVMGMAYLISAVLSYDPMLIAVLPDGRWICLGSWYE